MIAGTENLFAEAVDVGVQGEKTMRPVDRTQDDFALGHLQYSDARVVVGG